MFPDTITHTMKFSDCSKSEIQKEQTDMMVAQQKVLKNIAEKGNCVIVGRGADIILREYIYLCQYGI